METTNKTSITVEKTVKAPVEKVWRFRTEPEHITKWAFAMDTWHTPFAENDMKVGGECRIGRYSNPVPIPSGWRIESEGPFLPRPVLSAQLDQVPYI